MVIFEVSGIILEAISGFVCDVSDSVLDVSNFDFDVHNNDFEVSIAFIVVVDDVVGFGRSGVVGFGGGDVVSGISAIPVDVVCTGRAVFIRTGARTLLCPGKSIAEVEGVEDAEKR